MRGAPGFLAPPLGPGNLAAGRHPFHMPAQPPEEIDEASLTRSTVWVPTVEPSIRSTKIEGTQRSLGMCKNVDARLSRLSVTFLCLGHMAL